jgi:hypothetical protein
MEGARMATSSGSSEVNSESLHEEVARLRQRVEYLEEALASSRHALMKEFYLRQPLPFSERELKQIVAEEKGVPLEDFITELEIGPETCNRN